MTGIVLDPGTVSDLTHHFDVKFGALCEALGFQKFVIFLQFSRLDLKFCLDRMYRLFDTFLWHHKMLGRIDDKPLAFFYGIKHFTCDWVKIRYPVDLVSKKFNTDSVIFLCRIYLDRISA